MNPENQQPNPAQTPAPSMPPSTPTPAPMPMGGGKKPSKNVMIIAIVVVIVLAAAIAYGVYAYMANTPDSLMQSAVDNLIGKSTISTTYKVVSGTEANGVTISGDFAAKVDPSDSKNVDAILGLGTDNKRVALSLLSYAGTLY